MIKRTLKINILILVITSLLACNNTGIQEGKPSPSERNPVKLGSQEDTGSEEIQDQGLIVRSDKDNLMEVIVEDNIPMLTYNFPLWIRDYEYSEEYFRDKFYDQAFPIKGYRGTIKDVLIGKVLAFDHYSDGETIEPAIFILMEDGSVDWAPGNISFLNPESPAIHCVGEIPWIHDIESLVYENEGYRVGEGKVYGIGKDKKKYDLAMAYEFTGILNNYNSWVNDLGGDGTSYVKFDFYNETGLDFELGLPNGDVYQYQGAYYLTMDTNNDYNMAIMEFELYPDPLLETEKGLKGIHGAYYCNFHMENYSIEFLYKEGDYLYDHQGYALDYGILSYGFESFEEYNNDGDWGYLPVDLVTDDDYIDFLIKHSYKAREMVEEYGMDILVTDEYEDFGYEIYFRHIWLGTNHPGKFTKEILFAIGQDGTILEYDPLGDGWIDVYYHIFG